MIPSSYQPFIFVGELVTIYFLTKHALNYLASLIRKVIHHEGVVFSIVAIIFLPGTIIHELSHFFMAIILLLHVHSISIFPSWKNNTIKLGSVVYEKRDVFRSILVGIAPLLSGILFFWFIAYTHVFPHHSVYVNIGTIYLMYVVSTTMFSSKQDMIDFIYIVPVFIAAILVFFLFQLPVYLTILNVLQSPRVYYFFQQVNLLLFFSIVINSCIIVGIRILLRITHG